MNEQQWKKKLQEEADETLFADLKFDERLKAGVRAKVAAEATADPNAVRREGGEEGERSRRPQKLRRRRTITGIIAAAAFAATITFSLSGLFAEPDQHMHVAEGSGFVTEQPEGSEHGEVGTPSLLSDPSDIEAGTQELFTASGTDGGLGGGIDGVEQGQEVELTDLQEAHELYGEPLTLPSDIPDGYELVRIVALGHDLEPAVMQDIEHGAKGLADEIRLEYAKSESALVTGRGFVLHIHKQGLGLPLEQPYGEFIELNGREAWVSSIDLELTVQWMLGAAQYHLSGDLDRETMIRIAESVIYE